MKTILSMCDLTGNWARYYMLAGYRVILIDPKHGDNKPWRMTPNMDLPRHCPYEFVIYPHTIQHFIRHRMNQVHGVVGILFAPPCDDFAASGSRWWSRKDADGSTARSLAIVRAGLKVVRHYQRAGGLRFWVMENPKGRLARLMPLLRLVTKKVFQPFWYGDAYSKWTVLYGEFNGELQKREVAPVMYSSKGSRSSRLWYEGGKVSQGPDAVMRQKELKAVTPLGFARSFFRANP